MGFHTLKWPHGKDVVAYILYLKGQEIGRFGNKKDARRASSRTLAKIYRPERKRICRIR